MVVRPAAAGAGGAREDWRLGWAGEEGAGPPGAGEDEDEERSDSSASCWRRAGIGYLLKLGSGPAA